MIAVRDIMRTDVVTVRVDDSARTFARVLSDFEISGVPVLDARDRVVGVASATDLVRLAADEGDVNLSTVVIPVDDRRQRSADDEEAAESDPLGYFLPEESPWMGEELLERFPETSFDSMKVGEIMTPVTFSVTPDMSVPELCDFLVRGRIHRALVIEDGQLLGIVTSHDVLRGVAAERIA